MSLLIMRPKTTDPAPAAEKTRTRIGIKALIDLHILKGQRVTLEETIAILRANW